MTKNDICINCIFYSYKGMNVGICKNLNKITKKNFTCDLFEKIKSEKIEKKVYKKIIIKNGKKIFI